MEVIRLFGVGAMGAQVTLTVIVAIMAWGMNILMCIDVSCQSEHVGRCMSDHQVWVIYVLI